jgi:hypothetical protein
MPQNPEFSLNSETLGVVYKDISVLLGYASDTAEQPEETHAILGAYYEPSGEYKGLYLPLPDGEVKYFDVEVASIGSENDGAYVTFEADTKNWLIRGITGEDGAWVSKCRTELPRSVVEQLIIGRSTKAFSKFFGVNVPESLPEFEGVYVYYSDKSESVVALNYVSTYGTYTRLNGSWKSTDTGYDYYEDLFVSEINPEEVDELVKAYDDANDVYMVKDALAKSVDGGK